jgi:hypothetical protein
VRRVAARVKTRNHDQGVIFHEKKQRVGEPPQEGAADIAEHHGELPGMVPHPLDQSINTLTKRGTNPVASFSYQSCASIYSSRAARVKRTEHAMGNAVQAQR